MGRLECGLDTPPHPLLRVGAGSCDSRWPVAAYPTQLSLPPQFALPVPVPWFLTAAARASLLLRALSASLVRTVWWEVRVGLC